MTTKTHSKALTQTSALALATGMMMTASPALAQAFNNGSFQADGVVAEGQAQIFRDPDVTEIVVESQGVVIDWFPDDAQGVGDIDFQPFGTFATFRDDGIITDFAVLNRILPTDLTRRIVFNGTVVSEIQGQVGGTVFFYSPGGILVGSDAVFDVGNLGLTTAEPVTDGFGNFILGNTVDFSPSASTSEITIDPGAQIFADQNPGSYVALFAPRIVNRGDIFVDGQAALVGAESGTITFSPDGLFDIQVDLGSEFGQPIENTGIIGGAASLDGSSRVYMVAISKNTAATIAIRGGSSLGFDVANSAFMDGDTVVLSAGFNVTAGQIETTEQSDGFLLITPEDAGFDSGIGFTSSVIGKAASDVDVFVRDTLNFAGDATFSGRQALLSLNTNFATGTVGNLTVGGDLTLLADHARMGADVGTAHFRLFEGTTADIAGNLRVAAIGTVDGNGNGIVETGNTQVFVTGAGSVLNVGGNVVSETIVDLTNDFSSLTAQPFLAEVRAEDLGTINVGGVTRVINQAIAGLGGTATSGTADLFVLNGGQITTGEANVVSRAIGGDGDGMGLQAGTAFAGTASIRSSGVGSSITVQNSNTIGDPANGDLDFIVSEAIGGVGIDGNGGNAFAGNIELSVDQGGNFFLADDVAPLTIINRAIGGDTSEDDGRGGDASTGFSQIRVFEGNQSIGRLSFLGEAIGGSALPGAERTGGGNATTGSLNVDIANTTATIAFDQVLLNAVGGNASTIGSSFAGAGQAGSINFNISDSALNILSGLDLSSQGFGGSSSEIGGFGSTGQISIVSTSSNVNVAGDLIASLEAVGGASLGDQVFDPLFAFSEQGGGASSGSVSMAVNASEFAVAGAIGLSSRATGGDALVNQGGTATSGQVGIDMSRPVGILGPPVTILTASDVQLSSEAFGGSIQTAINPDSFGQGGDGSTSRVFVSFNGGENLLDSSVSMTNRAIGGDAGHLNGQGGQSSVSSASVDAFSPGSSTIAGNVNALTQSIAGDAIGGNGGLSFGSGNQIQSFSGDVTIGGNLTFASESEGGDGTTAGDAFGMNNRVSADTAAVNVLGTTTIAVEALGGDSTFGAAGQSFGGSVQLQAGDSGTIDLAGDVNFVTSAIGGNSIDNLGADASAAFNQISASNSGSINFGANLTISSSATAGNSVNATGGQGFGSANEIFVDNGNVAITGDADFAVEVTGGDGTSGGSSNGGSVTSNAFGGQIQIGGLTSFSSTSTGGDATTGTGGQAFGGLVRAFTFTNSTTELMGDVMFSSVTRGGNSADGAGGFSGGSSVELNSDGGNLTVGGSATLTGDVEGGSGTIGGNAIGSFIFLNAFQSPTFQINGTTTLTNNVTGGNATTGAGGNAEFGGLNLNSNGSTLDVTGDLIVQSTTLGGEGSQGGRATGPSLSANFENSTVDIAGNLIFDTQAFGGLGTGIGQPGGEAITQPFALNLQDTMLTTGGFLLLNSSAVGGDALDGDGGNATAGRRDMNISGGSTLNPTNIVFDGNALGGNALGMGVHSGGDAIADHARLNYSFDGASNVATVSSDVSFSNTATGGDAAAGGGNGGNADALNGEVYNFTTGTLSLAGNVNFNFVANGGEAPQGLGGSATLGAAQVLSFEGGAVLIDGGVNNAMLARGGDGQTGGNALGGVKEVTARGEVTIDGAYTSDEQVFGGNALANGMPGNGGDATPGQVFIIARNLDTIPETRLTIGSIDINATVAGGNGGNGLNGADGGTGGNAQGLGGLILGQAINGILQVNGATSISSTVTGGNGGNGVNGGTGGRAIFGGFQIGTSSGGPVPGAIGGSANFTTLDVTSNHVGGTGGAASNGTGGDGGEAVGSTATILSRGAPVNANSVNFTLNATGGIGGAGAAQGNGGDGVGGNGSLLATEAFQNPGRGSSNIGSFVLNSRGQGGVGATPGASEYSPFSDFEVEQSDVIIGSFTANITGDSVPDYTFDDGQGNQVPVTPAPFFVSLRDGATLDFGSFNLTTNGDVELFAGNGSSAVGNVFQIVAGNFVPTANDTSDPAYVPGTIDAATSLGLTATNGDIIAETLLVSANDLVLNSAGSIITRDLAGSSIFLTLGAGGVLDTGGVSAPGGLISIEAVETLVAPDSVAAASLLLRSLTGDVIANAPLTVTGEFAADAANSVNINGVSAQTVTLIAGAGDINSGDAINASGLVDLSAGGGIALSDVSAGSILASSQNGAFFAENLVAGGSVGVEASGSIDILSIDASFINLRSLNSFINVGSVQAEEDADIEAEGDVNIQMASARSLGLRSLTGTVESQGSINVDNAANIAGAAGVFLDDVSAGSLDVSSSSGDVAVTGTSTATGAANFNSGSGAVTLGDVSAGSISISAFDTGQANAPAPGTQTTAQATSAPGDVGAISTGSLNATGGSIDLSATGSIDFGTVDAGSLDVLSTSGDITAGGAVNSTGSASFETAGNIALGDVTAGAILSQSGGTTSIGGNWQTPNLAINAANIEFGAAGAVDVGASGSVSLGASAGEDVLVGGRGDPQFTGLSLSQTLLERFGGSSLAITGGVGSNIRIDDLDVSGFAGLADLSFSTGDSIDIVGALVSPVDVLLQANDVRVNLDTGSIDLGTDGTTLTVNAGVFVAGDSNVLENGSSDLSVEEIQTLINTPAATPRPDGVITAGSIVLNVGEVAVIQNVGTEDLPAGFVIGSAQGLVINGNDLDGSLVVLNGQIAGADGTNITGDDAATEIFSALEDPQGIGAGSQINGCLFAGCTAVSDDTGEITSTVSASVSGATAGATSSTSGTTTTTTDTGSTGGTTDSGSSDSGSSESGGESSESSDEAASEESDASGAPGGAAASGTGSTGGVDVNVDNVDDGGGGPGEFDIDSGDSSGSSSSDAGTDSGADAGSDSGTDSGADADVETNSDAGSDDGSSDADTSSDEGESASDEGDASDEGEASDESEGEAEESEEGEESEESEESEEEGEEEEEESSEEEEEDSEGPATGPIAAPPSLIDTNTLEQRGTINDPISGSGNPALLDPDVTTAPPADAGGQ